LTDRLLRLNPHPFWAGTARGQRGVALGDAPGEARFLAELRTRPHPWAQQSGGLVTWTTGNLAAGRRLWGLIREPTRSLGFRAMAHATLASSSSRTAAGMPRARSSRRSRRWTGTLRLSTAPTTG
jgi:hypothetical protein